MRCARTVCSRDLEGTGHYAIWNNQCSGTNEPRLYCISCGRKIIEPNERFDETKLRYELRFTTTKEEKA